MRAELNQDHRYAHVVRVARFAGRLAARHGVPAAKARTAGMLHDLARLYSAEHLLRECARRGIAVDAFSREHPVVLHAPLGAALARERYGVSDPAILSAITKHTTGAATMSKLDCIVYLADGLEPGRDFAGRAELARLAFDDLAAAMRGTLEASFAYLRERGLAPAPQTLEAARAFAAATTAGEVATG